MTTTGSASFDAAIREIARLNAINAELVAALEAVDSEIALDGQIKEIVDAALAKVRKE